MKRDKWLMVSLFILSLISIKAIAGVDEEIRFGRGESSTEIEGVVIRGDRDEYTLSARAGQLMSVEISSEEDNAIFELYGEIEGTWTPLIGADEGDEVTTWSNELPGGGSGVFKIIVGPTRGNASYLLEVEIE